MTTNVEGIAAGVAARLDEERLAWLALALTPGLGPRRTMEAVKEIGAASRIFELGLTDLESLKLPGGSAQFIFDGKARKAAEAEWAAILGAGRGRS